MIKTMFVIGTRPEAIKMAPIIMQCKKYSRLISPIIVAVSQHDALLSQALEIFNIVPDHNLHVMEKEQTLFSINIKILQRIEPILDKITPHLVLVQGDTTTVFACALAAYYKRIDIGHVEAGLRSFDKYNPFPEEINRRLTDALSDIHFAPTETAKKNLMKEGIDKNNIFITGNPVIDALYLILKRKWVDNLKQINWKKRIILVTVHRRESFGKGLLHIANALKTLANNNSDIEILFPVHPNPKVSFMKKKLREIENIKLFEPFDYITFVNIMKRSSLILTDSGGVQEEAPSLGIPVLVLREVTERPEAVRAGCVRVVGVQTKKIVVETERLLHNKVYYDKMAKSINPYGDGKASERIIKAILRKYR